MSQEIICTSAPRGLKPGSKGGFCTVAATEGMSVPLAEQLERLSGYRPFYPVGHPDSANNPIAYAHWRVAVGGRTSSVLSRVAFAIDYSQRTSRIAHHLVLDNTEQPPAGPAWAMMQPGVMETDWSGEPHYLAAGRDIPHADAGSRVCRAWAAATGDAGWAGVLAEAFVLDGSRPAYVLAEPGTALLPLIDEAISLLPKQLRWQVTFNTYFTSLPAGLSCTWRCCVAGSESGNDAPKYAASGVVIDLTRPMGQVKESKYVRLARAGEAEEVRAPIIGARNEPLRIRDAEEATVERATTISPRQLAPSVAGRRRLATNPGATPYEIVAEDDEVAEPWGGPVASTALDERPLTKARRGSAGAFWAFAALWPLVVLSAGFVWHVRHKMPVTTSIEMQLRSQTEQLTREKETEHAEKEKAQADRIETMNTRERELADRYQEGFRDGQKKPNPGEFIPKPQPTTIPVAPKSVTTLPTSRSARETELEQQKSYWITRATDAENQLAHSPSAKSIPAEIARYPKSPYGPDQSQPVSGPVSATSKISLSFPDGNDSYSLGSNPADKLYVMRTSDGNLAVWRKFQDKDMPLVDLSIRDGKVIWTWKEKYLSAEPANQKKWDTALLLSSLRIDDSGKHSGKQFLKLIPGAAWNIMQEDYLLKVAEEFPKAAIPRLHFRIEDPPKPWKFEISDDGCVATATAAGGARFTIERDADSLTLKSDWAGAWRTTNQSISDLIKAANTQWDRITQIEREMPRAKGEKGTPEEKKEQRDDWQRRLDDARKQHGDFQKQLPALRDRGEMYRSFRTCHLLLELPNGVRVAEIELSTKAR